MGLFVQWMAGAVLVAVGTVSFGYGAGMMWRAWHILKAQTL